VRLVCRMYYERVGAQGSLPTWRVAQEASGTKRIQAAFLRLMYSRNVKVILAGLALLLVLVRATGSFGSAETGSSAPCTDRPFGNPRPLDLQTSEKVSFVALGDWGLDLDASHDDGPRKDWDMDALQSLAKEMGKTAKSTGASFVLNLGDNFYQYGVKSAEDERWKTTYEDFFTEEKSLTWYGMLGNHDYKGNLEWEDDSPITRTSKVSLNEGMFAQIYRTFHPENKRWCLPSTNYTLEISAASFDVALVVFDSQSIARFDPSTDTGAYGNNLIPKAEDQLAWLEDTLCSKYKARARESSRPLWLFTASHHFAGPSIGNYFDTINFDILPERVEPILRKCGVHIHFHGHDHVSQILGIPRANGSSLLQVGLGCSAKNNGIVHANQFELDEKYPNEFYKILAATGESAFGKISLTKEYAEVEMISAWGKPKFLQQFPYDRNWASRGTKTGE